MARFIPPRKKERDSNKDSAWHRARTCAVCGISPYPWGRCESYKGWTERNPGHRDGWSSTKRNVCLRCVTTQKSQRMLNLIQLPPARKSA